jgi:hypothetical protein
MFRIAPLLVLCFALAGCFVFDELDSGMEMMEKNSPQNAKKAEAPAGEDPNKPPSGDAWWSSAKSIDRRSADESADPADPTQLVSCRLSGGTRFMRRGDCLSQGGTPKG